MRSFEDRAFSAVAIAVVAALGWRMTSRAPLAGDVPPIARPVAVPLEGLLDARVRLVAEAIARSEGYYAPGSYDGHSLPYYLNNPGSLKAAWSDGGRMTWKDTDLLVFATPDAGWTALRRQVCTMLTGTSRHYALEDDLVAVGVKYADGDVNWGANVAWHLRLSPRATLADLRGGLPAGRRCAGD